MDKKEIYSYLTKEKPDLNIYMDEKMSKHTSFKIGGNADILVKAKTLEEVEFILKFVRENKIKLTIIGNGSNLLVKDNGIRGITMQVNIDTMEIDSKNQTAIVGSGVKLIPLAMALQKNGLTGFEFASGIPGTIGGAVRMNAGAYGGEMKDVVQEVEFITTDGKIETLKNEDLHFSYRHSRFCDNNDIILSAKLKFQKGNPDEIKQKMSENNESRKQKQPIELPNAGSTFKRGEDFIAAKLIDDCGLKGYKIGGAEVSTKHAGFVVNTGNATAQNVIDLIDYITKTVYEKFGKELETEIEIIGE